MLSQTPCHLPTSFGTQLWDEGGGSFLLTSVAAPCQHWKISANITELEFTSELVNEANVNN